jgi:alpha-glucosidase
VAEAWLAHPSRLPRYASATGLGQAFNFDLLEADWDAGQFRSVIAAGLEQASESGASSTWVLSNHDVVRHASRYGLPAGDGWALDRAKAWVTSDGAAADLDHDLGLRRARAATLLVLALPGSVYLYQGEELGLHEVPDLPASVLADPTFRRSGGAEKGRDGCRVPIPWTASGPSFGFGPAGAHLPQPAWFGQVSVEAQAGDPASTLALYRQALALRRRLAAGEELAWAGGDGADVVHFRRPGGWESVTNFAAAPVPLPAGRVVIASGPLDEGSLPPDTTAWIVRR